MQMIIPLAALHETTGETIPFSFRFAASEIYSGGEKDAGGIDGDIIVQGKVTCLSQSEFLAAGTLRYTRHFTCDRCLKEAKKDETVDFSERFSRQLVAKAIPSGTKRPFPAKGRKERDAEYTIDSFDLAVRFSGDEIDLLPTVREAIVLARPIQDLCRPDCRGLCPKCGRDLNLGDCGCDRRSIDPRWEAMADYFQKE